MLQMLFVLPIFENQHEQSLHVGLYNH